MPLLSRRRSEKSRTIQRKAGKYLAISSGSQSPTTSDLSWSSLERLIYATGETARLLTIRLRFWIADSSIVPIEL